MVPGGDGAWPDLRHKNKVYGRGRRPKDGGRKRGAEGVGSAASLLMGTRARDGGDRQNPGKPHDNPRKGVRNRKKPVPEGPAQMTGLQRKPLRPFEYGKLRLRENRRF